MAKEDFYAQIESFTAPVGFVYYVKRYERKWNDISECYSELLDNLKTVNDYDPMQLHGVKTDEEMEEMVQSRVQYEFDRDQKFAFELVKGVVSVRPEETIEDQRLEIESSPNFIRWWDTTNRK